MIEKVIANIDENRDSSVERLLDYLRIRSISTDPACAEICPTGAIVFGDLDNPNHRVAQLSKDPRAFRLLEDLGTHPKVYYLAEEG